ncbi:dockerin type I repeat-containing protein [Pseudobacteroides cellulosolvens]|uniref:Dockerin type 1 protein n=1 Tax=Pseudobacteroides cellulosolvens ATCC 35603 = DSM 2933 TaxID=398512 RepID=A0A0L6JIL1_9FIRM|nr:dockerin type I repeat-containing protein [Pseudobacteroides cellulosolvens]KNY25579.1 Dockerin type 1 protein [Pseudobacteroides cellulosolvens ATCC 35603 = DSM 2933]
MKKRIGSLLVGLGLFVTVMGTSLPAFAAHSCTETVTIGDVNLDGSVNAIDLLLLKQEIDCLVYFDNLQCIAADVDYNAAITMADYNMLKDYLLGNITSFPAGSSYTVYYGDVTGDQLVTDADKTKVSNYILGSVYLTSREFAAADVNGDQVVNSGDLTLINRHILNIEDHFPVCPQI